MARVSKTQTCRGSTDGGANIKGIDLFLEDFSKGKRWRESKT